MHFQRLLLLFVASNSGKRYWDWTLPRIKAQIELSSTFVYDYKMSTAEHEWQFCKEFAPHPGGTNDNDAHACEPNYITVQNKLSHKYCSWTQGAHTICLCLCSRHKQIVWAPCVVNKFTTPNLIFVTPSFNEWVVFRDYYVLLCSTCQGHPTTVFWEVI